MSFVTALQKSSDSGEYAFAQQGGWKTSLDRFYGEMTMHWLHDLSYFFGGMFLTNAIPHFVSGVMGRPFQSPFAKPPGKGLSSSVVNAIWGFCNLVVSYLLLCRVGQFDLRDNWNAGSVGVGMLLMAVMTAHMFGKLHGGNKPLDHELGIIHRDTPP